MPVHPKPILHGRDHTHGGADPVLLEVEDVGSGTSGGGAGGLQFELDPQAGAWLVATTTGYEPDGANTPGMQLTVEGDVADYAGGFWLENFAWGGINLLDEALNDGPDGDIGSGAGITLTSASEIALHVRLGHVGGLASQNGLLAMTLVDNWLWAPGESSMQIGLFGSPNIAGVRIENMGVRGQGGIMLDLGGRLAVTDPGGTYTYQTRQVQIVLNSRLDTANNGNLAGNKFAIYQERRQGSGSFASRAFGPLLEVRDDGTYHIKAGASWVADL